MKYAPTVVTTLFLLTVLAFYAAAQNVSDEARRHFDRGIAAVETAKTIEDLDLAISEFKQATTLAPDWADAYYNLGKVQEAAQKYSDAIVNFQKYLQLSPAAPDAGDVRSLIDKVSFKSEQQKRIKLVFDLLINGERKMVDCSKTGNIPAGYGQHNILWVFRRQGGRLEVQNEQIAFTQRHPPNPGSGGETRQAWNKQRRLWEPVEVSGDSYRYTWAWWVDYNSGYEVEIINDVTGRIISVNPPRILETVESRFARNIPILENPGQIVTGSGSSRCTVELGFDPTRKLDGVDPRDQWRNSALTLDSTALKNGIRSKIAALYGSQKLSDKYLTEIFATMSVAVSQFAPNANCFGGDSGVMNRDWNFHYRWAKARSRSEQLDNLLLKSLAVFDCADRQRQIEYYATISSYIAWFTPTDRSP